MIASTVVPFSSSARTIDSAPSLGTQRAIVTLLTVYSAGRQGMSPEDRAVTAAVYLRIVAAHAPETVEAAVESLIRENPQGAFCPTPEDVANACDAQARAAESRVRTWLRGSEWHQPPEQVAARQRMLGRPAPRDDGPAPFAPGCRTSPTFVRAVIAEMLDTRHRDWIGDWVDLADDRFESIPPDAFPAGKREEILAARAHAAYVAGLPPDVRLAREEVMRRYLRPRVNRAGYHQGLEHVDLPPEPELLRLAHELLRSPEIRERIERDLRRARALADDEELER